VCPRSCSKMAESRMLRHALPGPFASSCPLEGSPSSSPLNTPGVCTRRKYSPPTHQIPLHSPHRSTTASADFSHRGSSPRHPFGCEGRPPQARTRSFPIRPPDLRCLSLDHRDLRLLARSPRSASPPIRFLFVGPSLRSTLPSHARSPSRSCASLQSR